MQDCSGDLPGAKDASQLADGWVVVGRSGWHGICSPGKHRLCLYGVSTQQWSCRKSTRLNSSHTVISYAVFCLKKKKQKKQQVRKEVQIDKINDEKQERS